MEGQVLVNATVDVETDGIWVEEMCVPASLLEFEGGWLHFSILSFCVHLAPKLPIFLLPVRCISTELPYLYDFLTTFQHSWWHCLGVSGTS